MGEVCPWGPLEGPDEPGTGLAHCPRPGPNQGYEQREAPVVGMRLTWSRLEMAPFVLGPRSQCEGAPGLGSDLASAAPQLKDLAGIPVLFI